jgi:hypothetical protein
MPFGIWLMNYTGSIEMTDVVVRLRCDAGEFFMRYGDTLLTEAADEIERLKAERDTAIKEIGKWSREAGASQAREAKLREALEGLVSWVYASAHWGCTPLKVIYAQAVLALPTDDTALQEAIEAALQASPEFDLLTRIGQYLSDVDYIGDYVEGIKQAKREALMEAADFLFSDGQHNHWAVKELRRMAKEIK